MNNKPEETSSVSTSLQKNKTLASAGLFLALVALLPSAFIYTLRYIDAVIPRGFTQSQDYAFLLPVILANILMVTVVPLAGVTAIILSIKVIKKSQSRARNVGIIASIIVVAAFIMTAMILYQNYM